jgi:hypothetical protein
LANPRIQVTVFTEGKRGYRKAWRTGTRYLKLGERETCLVRVEGQNVWAERFPNTVWTCEVLERNKRT